MSHYQPLERHINITNLPTAEIVVNYFDKGFPYVDIIDMMKIFHDVKISLRTLNRILRSKNLKRRGRIVHLQTVTDNIARELVEDESSKGYRAMHQTLTRKGISVDRDTVRLVLKEMDPKGVEIRSKHKLKRRKYFAAGPNDIWHLDGNDKIKPYGFSIHGCIDGFSRKMIWLRVAPSNKNPAMIANYFLDAVTNVKGTARRIRADRGVENSTIAGVQRYFNRNSINPDVSFIFGKSVNNQRIEAWWSFFRKRFLQKWMNFFKDLIDEGLFDNSNIIEQECLRFCFYGLIQDELDDVASSWNQHRIRPTRNSHCHGGVPDVMYFIPFRYNTNNKKVNVTHHDILLANGFQQEPPYYGCDSRVSELAHIIMAEHHLKQSQNREEAKELYKTLVYEMSSL